MKKNIILLLIAFVFAGIFYYFYLQRPASIKIVNVPVATKDEKLINTAREVLSALSKEDYQGLEEMTSPDGLTLNFYPRLDLSKVHSTKENISEIPSDTKVYLFGYTDGKGDPVNLTTFQFIKQWIYNHEYENAPQVAVNKTLGSGNSLNKITEDAASRDFVVFYFPGFDPQYEGMDWTSIYLVFDNMEGEYKLRAIAKDNWTI